jgi:hypothetical protein
MEQSHAGSDATVYSHKLLPSRARSIFLAARRQPWDTFCLLRMDGDSDSEDNFDYEQFLLAEQVRKYYYRGLYPLGILVIWLAMPFAIHGSDGTL